ncbi:MAG: type 4a pilus biogenesis protein PilO [Candidatus Omnitrophica bacterium]|nr:type 4a pilus biogenesis protein PilO [Candidatus Omnitrophota bacterium]
MLPLKKTLQELEELLRRQPKAFLAGGLAALFAAAWVAYVPAFSGIQRHSRQWSQIRSQLIEARRVVDEVGQKDLSPLPDARSLPGVLERLGSTARSHQVQLLGVTPGPQRSSEVEGLAVVPMELQVEGEYRSLGEFLGALTQTPSLGAVFVKHLSMNREERLMPRLRAQVSIEVFLSGAGDGSS